MPRGDQTGPRGMGARSGRGLGCCAGNDRPGFANAFGFRRGRGERGPGAWLRWGSEALAAWTHLSDEDEVQQLRQELADAQARLRALEEREKSS